MKGIMPSFDIPELAEVIRNLEEILNNQRALAEQLNSMKGDSLPAWIGLREACALKGVAYSTIQKPENKHLMPPLSERQRVGKALKWPRDVILKWLLQDDGQLEIVKNKLQIVQNDLENQKRLNEVRRKERMKMWEKLRELTSEIDKHSQESQ
jgi:hypothetical protein